MSCSIKDTYSLIMSKAIKTDSILTTPEDVDVDDDDFEMSIDGDADNDIDNDAEEIEEVNDEDEDAEDNDRVITARKNLYQINDCNDNTRLTIVKPEKRITSDRMTVYEYASVIGTRATHISKGAPLYTEIGDLYEPRDIAIKEINEGMCPLSISRRIGNTQYIEIWEVNEMVKPNVT